MDKVIQVMKDLFGCFFGTCFMLLALGLFWGGAVVGAAASLLFGLGITPLRRKLMWPAKVSLIVLSCLFLISCGSLVSIASTEEPEPVLAAEDEEDWEPVFWREEEIETVSEPEDPDKEETDSKMQVHFIDVGQGDATLIISGEHAMLIDAGDDSKGTRVQLYLKNQGIEKLDYLVLTHTDADHIGGADVIISKFPVDNVFIGDFPKESDVYRELLEALKDKGVSYSTPEVGDTYALGDAFFMIAAPNRIYSDPNNSSIALVLQNGVNRFLFTGDAEEKAEADILANGLNISCDVFKVGHHGSNMSNTYALLTAASPLYAVISCEADNSYGHPHAEVLNNLRAMDVKVFRTDEQGSVMATSDGREITWNCAPSDSWKAGERTQNSTDASEGDEVYPQQDPEEETVPEPQQPVVTGNYAVNGRNGKIHKVGACLATGTGDGAMASPVYFVTYEEAEAYSMQLESNPDNRKCKNCYK